MRKIAIDEINGGEILAKSLISKTGILVMSEGAVLRTAYRSRLKELDIDSVYIIEAPTSIVIEKEKEEEIKGKCIETVREVIDKYSYSIDAELSEISVVVEDIVTDVLKQQEVLYNISRVRDKNETIYIHSISVCTLAVLIGAKMSMTKKRLKNLAVGAVLHDIGLIYLPFNVNGDIDDEIYNKEIKKHVVYGYSAVEKEDWMNSISKDIIISHHERADGSGFPFHLTGDKLSVEAKIVAVCDEFDSLVYGIMKPKKKVHEAIDQIVKQAGEKFDFKVVQTFVSCVAAFPLGTIVLTNMKEVGIVIKQNNNFPTRPIIKVMRIGDKDTKNTELDLLHSLDRSIVDTIESDE